MAQFFSAMISLFVMIFSIGLLTLVLIRTITAYRKKVKIKKYDLNLYNILTDAKGLPSCLISKKDNNDIVYL